MLHWLDDHSPLPPTHMAMGAQDEAPGLLAAGGTVTVQRLEEAYRRGIYPWFSPGQPPLWWAPDPRMVLRVGDFKLAPSLRKTLRRFLRTPGTAVRVDTAFAQVIEACAQAPRDGQHGTWIVPAIAQTYTQWHSLGRAHSVETWVDGELVGGLYGVGMGRMFFGESMFARRTDASKIALAALVALCRHHGITLIDCQQNTAHLASLGAREISRHAFEQHLTLTLGAGDVLDWTYDESMWQQLKLDTYALEASAAPAPLSSP